MIVSMNMIIVILRGNCADLKCYSCIWICCQNEPKIEKTAPHHHSTKNPNLSPHAVKSRSSKIKTSAQAESRLAADQTESSGRAAAVSVWLMSRPPATYSNPMKWFRGGEQGGAVARQTQLPLKIPRGTVFLLHSISHFPVVYLCKRCQFLRMCAKVGGAVSGTAGSLSTKRVNCSAFIHWTRPLWTRTVFTRQCLMNWCWSGLFKCDCISVCSNRFIVKVLKRGGILQPAGQDSGGSVQYKRCNSGLYIKSFYCFIHNENSFRYIFSWLTLNQWCPTLAPGELTALHV